MVKKDKVQNIPTDIEVVQALLTLRKYTKHIDEKPGKCSDCILERIRMQDICGDYESICELLPTCFDHLIIPEHLFNATLSSDKQEHLSKNKEMEVYKQACEDMWDFVKAITLSRSEYPNAITIHEMKQIYGEISSAKNIIQHFDGYEALRNYQDWKRNCITLGDEIIDDHGDKGIVTWIDKIDNQDFDLLLEDGSFINSYTIYDDVTFQKTGRNFKEQVDTLMKCFDRQEESND